jgi:probable HAF family extracellular repeat protein
MTLFAALTIPVQLAAQKQTTHFRHYKLIDIGTFGGPASYFTEPGVGRGELVLNSQGILAGKADTSIPDPHSGNCPPICFDTKVFRWKRGVLTALDGLSKAVNNSDVASINARGWISGNSAMGDIDPLTGGQIVHGVLWKDDEITDLGTLGGLWSSGTYVTDGGAVVGISTINTIADPFSFLGGSIHPFIWKNGVMQDLGTLGGPDALPGPSCASESSQRVTGFSFIDSTPNPDTGVPTAHPFLWENGKMTDLGTLGGTIVQLDVAQCVNNRGQVAGVSTLPGDQIIHPFFWDHGVLTDLGTLGGDFTITSWLNDAGDVVGGTTTTGEALFRATLWRHGAITDLGALDDDCISFAHAINSKGQIVGESDSSCDFTTGLKAVLWDKEAMVDLNTLIPEGSSLHLIVGVNINDRGEIAGQALAGCSDVNACAHDFLLIPVCNDDNEGCKDAPLDPALIAKSQSRAGVSQKRMTAEELATFKERIARMAGRSRAFGLWQRR